MDFKSVDLTNLLSSLMKQEISKCSEKQRKFAYKTLCKMYNKDNVGSNSEHIDFSKVENQVAYLYSFAPIHTKMILDSLKAVWTDKKCKKAVNQWYTTIAKTSRGQVNVCALGGGPGLEVACAYLWLEKLITDTTSCKECQDEGCDVIHSYHRRVKSFKGTILDSNLGWKPVSKRLFEALRGSVCPPAISIAPSTFISRDLLRSFDREISRKISESNLVIMMKFLSAVSKNKSECTSMLKNIMESMKPGALLLVIDGLSNVNIQLVQEAAKTYGMKSIYFKKGGKITLSQIDKKRFYTKWFRAFRQYFGGKSFKPCFHSTPFVQLLQKPECTIMDEIELLMPDYCMWQQWQDSLLTLPKMFPYEKLMSWPTHQ